MAAVKCDFCRRYLDQREFDKSREDENPMLHHEYGAVLLVLTWNDQAGRHHYSDMMTRPRPEGFALGYCPECGRRLQNVEEA